MFEFTETSVAKYPFVSLPFIIIPELLVSMNKLQVKVSVDVINVVDDW